MTKIILASASPRRHALLRQIGVPFEVHVSRADESLEEDVPPCDFVTRISQRKSLGVHTGDDAIIIAADTVVVIGGQILGKPKDAADAYEMLQKLQGNPHTVYTGVTLVRRLAGEEERKSFTDAATVYIRALTGKEIRDYIHTGEPFDKAGAYAVQGKGALLVERIEGDYHTVVGLPLVKVYLALKEWGADLMET